MRQRLIFWSVLVSLISVLAACNLGAAESDDSEAIATATDTGPRPTVNILSPDDGDEVVANQQVLVEVSTSGNADNVELFANGDSVRQVFISDNDGDTSRSVLNYTPEHSGEVVLRAVAYRGEIASRPDQVVIEVRRNENEVTATSENTVPIINPSDRTCRAFVDTNLNLRDAPTLDSNVIRVLVAGEILPLTARLADNSWIQVRDTFRIGWVSALYVTLYGDCNNIAVINVSPTAAPTLTPRPTSIPIPTTQPSATPRPTETPSMPDLIVSSINGPTSVTIPAGQASVSVEYNVTVTNQGGPFNGQYNTVGRLLPGGAEFDFATASSLGVNQSITLRGEVTFEQTGTFALQVTTDSDNEIDESRDNNNSTIINVTVTQGE